MFICIECACIHRDRLGTHLSLLRYWDELWLYLFLIIIIKRHPYLDSWNEAQLALMRVGGNEKAAAFFGKHVIKCHMQKKCGAFNYYLKCFFFLLSVNNPFPSDKLYLF